jgi:polyphosphate kinase 2
MKEIVMSKSRPNPKPSKLGEAATPKLVESKHEPQDETERPRKLKSKFYRKELARLQGELVKLQAYVKVKGLKVVILFEGRDAAGKGGTIKRIIQRLNPRACKIAALGTPTERERSQWYFQRYVAELPAAGEIVLFDRSWYNRAGVERVMKFCTDKEYAEFARSCPEFERMLVRSDITLLKYWFSVSDEEQERRFRKRIADPTKRWKLSPMDLESRSRWVDYSRAKDDMLAAREIMEAPWWIVPADNKPRAHLNCIAHILGHFSYLDYSPKKLTLPRRQVDPSYVRPEVSDQNFVPQTY